MSNYLIQRNGIYYFMRRVPDYVAHLDTRNFVRSSLKTRDKRKAIKKSGEWNDYIEEFWENLIQDDKTSKDRGFNLAVKQAKLHGFDYKTADEIAKDPREEIVDRVLLASKQPEIIPSVLGGHSKPDIFLGSLWDEFYQFKRYELLNKSPKQLKRWINPRIRAYKTFIQVCGDIPLNDITRHHILKFRAWWSDRLQEEDMAPNSANKDLTHLRSLLAYAQDNKEEAEISVETLFARIRFKERDSERMPFSNEHILSHILNPDKLMGLNDECRYFLFAMADTGARPSELLGLDTTRGDINLESDIPYIDIRPDTNRELKNQYSQRKIPLVGASLYAFKQLQGGFKQYYQRSDELSANLNGFLRDHHLLPTENHTVYSLRHSFEDRLSAVEPPEKLQSFIMGHKYRRERYGQGPTLEQKKNWLDRIGFKQFE